MSAEPRWKHALRVVAYVVLATVVVVTNVVAAALLYAGTGRAREQVVRLGLRALGPVFPGGVHVGRTEGSLLRGMVIHDLVVEDLNRRPAVEVGRIDVSYALLALFLARVEIDHLRVEGVRVVSRPLADGRDNLATIAVIRKPKLPRTLPVSVVVEELAVDARILVVEAGMREDAPPRDRDLRARLTAYAALSHGMVVSLGLRVEGEAPARISLRLDGSMHVAEKPTLRGVDLRVAADTSELRRHVEELRLSGPLTLAAHASGPLDDLLASLRADATEPRVHLRAAAHLFGDRAELRGLDVRAPFARVDASGTYFFDRSGQGAVHIDAGDLRAVALFGGPSLAGAAKLDAKVTAEHGRMEGTADGELRRFRAANARVGHVSLTARVRGLEASARLRARSMIVGATELTEAHADLRGDPRSFHIDVGARGPEGLDVTLAMLGTPRTHAGHLLGLEARLESLRLRAGGAPWATDHPAHVSVDLDGHSYALERLALSSGKQHIEVEGRITNRAIEGARVAIEHFDLSQLPAVLSPGHVLPHTDLDAELDGRGTFEEPEVHARFHGEGDGRGQHDLIHMSGTAEGELLRGRLNAKVFATIGGQKASAKLDVPMPPRPDQPIAVSFDASVLLSPFFADLLVPKIIQSQPILLYSLGAKVTAQGDLHGTTSDPRIHASARVARWGAANSHGNLAVSVEYAAKKLQLASTLDFSELPLGGGKGAGVVQATGVVPVDLALPLSGERGRVFDRRARLHAAVGIHDLDVSRLPWEALAVVPLVRHGRVDGTLDVAGSWASPEAKLNIAARELDVAGMNGVTLDGAAELEGSAGTADVRVAVRGADALHAHATLGERGVAADLRHAPLTASFEIPGFDLGRTDVMKELDGVLRASVRLRGSWAKPTGEAHVELAQLRSGETRFRDCVFDGRASDGALRGVLSLDEEQGGALQAKAEEDRSGKLSGELEARRFVIDARSELLPWLRELRAVVDGRLTLGGTRADPRLLGELDVSDGHLRLARSAIDYRALAAKARFADDGIEVSDLRAATGSGGQLGGHLRLGVAQAKLARLHGALSLRRFPFAWETLSGRLDASVELDGAPAKTGFATIARLDGARVTLVDDHGLPHLLPLQRLDDLSTGVARPQPVVDPVTAPKVRARAPSLAIVGPFSVSGAEIDARGAADLRVDLDTPIPNATGTLRLESGTVELYGARYTLERGLLRFAGDPDPTLELRVMRDAPRGRIGVELGGSTRQPTTRFVSESAVYDPGQVASLVTGQRLEKGGVRKKGIGEKVGGPISSLIATSFRQTDPGRSVVDVSRPVSSKKVETYESILPASTK